MTIKTITTEQLEALTWHVADIDCGDHEWQTHHPVIGLDEDGVEVTEPVHESYVFGTCTLRSVEHPEITYAIEWMAQGGKHTIASAYDFEIEVSQCLSNSLDAPGYTILDIDGDEISEREAVRQVGNDIEQSVDWEAEVRNHLPNPPAPETIDDIDEDSDMQTITLQRDDGPDVRFQGDEIASASSHHYEGPRNIRWTELTLYRTRGGKLVCHEIGRTIWQGERTRYAVHITDTKEDMIESLGYGWLAKDLYDEAGIDHAVDIG